MLNANDNGCFETGVMPMLKLKNIILILCNYVAIVVFVVMGKKPWAFGYGPYKMHKISEYLNDGTFRVSGILRGYGRKIDERIVEYPWLFDRLPKGDGVLLDAGSALNFDFLLNGDKLKSKQVYISTLAPEINYYKDKNVSYIYQDLRNTCFKDDFFDYIVSISTIEHIGLDNTLLYTDDDDKNENNPDSFLVAIKEFRRILKSGGKIYLTVPFGAYRNHDWFQVFSSDMIDLIKKTFVPSQYAEQIFIYRPDGWSASSRDEARNGMCFDAHVNKHYDPSGPAFSEAVACIEMTK